MQPHALKGRLVFVNAPTRDSDKSRRFYGALLGAEFAHGLNPNVPSWWTPLGRGVDFNITVRYDDRERLTPYFAVESLDAAVKELEGLGGRCVVPPRDVLLGPDEARQAYVAQQKKEGHDINPEQAKTVGRIAVLLDPDLNHVGLIQLAAHAKHHFGLDEIHEDQAAAAAFKSGKKLADQLEAAGALPKI
jgi:predicted enzyme related to lactoylglutathione lyase